MFNQFKEFMDSHDVDKRVQGGSKNDPSGNSAGPYGHGSGGLFSASAQDAMIFSAFMTPVGGIASVLPTKQNQDDKGNGGAFGGVDNEFFSTITGVTQGAAETFANQPTTPCADGARAGLMKVCTLVSTYARYRFSPSNPISMFDAGRRRDHCDPDYLQLVNSPMVAQMFGVPTSAASERNWLINEFSRRTFEMAVSISRFMADRMYIGSPSNNSGDRRDITGFDTHIAQGNKRDAFSSNLCTAMDAELLNFDYELATGSGRNIQSYAEAMIGKLDFKTQRQGLGAQWDGWITMRPEQWDEIVKTITLRQYSDVIASANAISGAAKITVNADARTAFEQQEEMRNGKWWPLRGRRIPVVLDDGIAEITPNQTTRLLSGQYAADIYFIPRSVLGNIPVSYTKYYDHRNGNSESLAQMVGSDMTATSDNGQFRWYFNFRNGCLDWTVDWSPRLIERTPQISGRIQKVSYQPMSHFASPFPSSDYFANGGRTTGPTQQFYAQWSGTTPTTL